MGQKLTFTGTKYYEDANNGLGEWKAHFAKGEDLAKAFGSVAGKPGLSTKGGVVPMNLKQIGERIETLAKSGGHEDTIAQLEHGRTAIETKLAPKAHVQPAMRVG